MEAPSDQVTATAPFAALVPVMVGAKGMPKGVTGNDVTDGGELPALVVATTVKVVGVPLVSP